MDGNVVTLKKIMDKVTYVEGRVPHLATYIITHTADEPCVARKLAELYGREIAIDPSWNWAGSGVKYAMATLPAGMDLYNRLPQELKGQVELQESFRTMNWREARAIKISDKSLNSLLKNSGTWIRIKGWYADAEKEEFGVSILFPHKIHTIAESLVDLGEVKYRQLMNGWDIDVLESALYLTQTKEHKLTPTPFPLEINDGLVITRP